MRWLLVLTASLWLPVSALADSRQPASPQRIVSLSPHATELLYVAGLGDHVVGVSESCDFPDAAKLKPKVSGYRGTNVEAVLALKPDLVVAWPSGNRAADIDAISRFGVAVHTSELSTLAGITDELRLFSRWLPDASAANDVLRQASAADALVQTLRLRYANMRKVRVFYQLGPGRLFTLTDKHVIGEALNACGAENVFGKLALSAPEVSREAVLAAKPDAVLVADDKSLPGVRSNWQSSALFAGGLARSHVIAVDGARLHRPTMRTFAAVKAMCEAIDGVRQTLR